MKEFDLTDLEGRTHTVSVSKANLLEAVAALERDQEILRARVKALDRRIAEHRRDIEAMGVS